MKKLVYSFLFFLFAGSLCFASSGYVYVTSNPSGAVLKVDGKLKAKTPVMLRLSSGKHKIEATLKSYAGQVSTVNVIADEIIKLHFDLKKGPVSQKPVFFKKGKGAITIITDIPDAEIFIDGYKIEEKTPATVKDLSAGLHSIIVVKGNFAVSRKIFVRTNKTTVLNIKFKDMEKVYAEKLKKEMEEKRKNLPAKITVKLGENQKKESEEEVVIWGENDIIDVIFKYKKEGDEQWNEKKLSWKEKKETTFPVEKGKYEIEISAIHYKEDTGLITIFVKAEKKKVGEGKIILKKEFLPDTHYTFHIFYDGEKGISYKIEENRMNTPTK